jgi:1-aminocyclopropane-1-carboxylate deaminase
MKCRLVQESWVPHEDAVYDRVGNILLSRVMGADVRLVDEGFDIGIRKSWEQAINEVKAAGGKPYAIPAGASVHKYGGLGYVGFAEEVRAQEKALGFRSTTSWSAPSPARPMPACWSALPRTAASAR